LLISAVNRVAESLARSPAARGGAALTHAERAALPQGVRRDPVRIFGRIRPELQSTVDTVDAVPAPAPVPVPVPVADPAQDTSYGQHDAEEEEECPHVSARAGPAAAGDPLPRGGGEGGGEGDAEDDRDAHAHRHAHTHAGGQAGSLRRRQQPRRSAPAMIPTAEHAPAPAASSAAEHTNFIARSYGQQTSCAYQSPHSAKHSGAGGSMAKNLQPVAHPSNPERKSQQTGSYSWGDANVSSPVVLAAGGGGGAARMRAQTESAANHGPPEGEGEGEGAEDEGTADHPAYDEDDDVFQAPVAAADAAADGWEEVCNAYFVSVVLLLVLLIMPRALLCR
jgi:hypothetical protein